MGEIWGCATLGSAYDHIPRDFDAAGDWAPVQREAK